MAKNTANKITLLVNLKSEGGAQVAATISEAIKRGTKSGSASIQNILLPLLQDLSKSITTGREKTIKDPAAYVKSLEKNIKKFNNSFETLIYSEEALKADKQRLEEVQKEIQEIKSVKRVRTDSIYKTAYQSNENLLDDKRAKSLKSLQKNLLELQKGKNKELLTGFDIKSLKNFDNLFLHLKEVKETKGIEEWTNGLKDFYEELEKRYNRVKTIQEELYIGQRKNLPSLEEEQSFLKAKINDSENLTEETKEYHKILLLISDLLEKLKYSGEITDISDKGLQQNTVKSLNKEKDQEIEKQKQLNEADKKGAATVDGLVQKYLSLGFAFAMLQKVGSQMFNTIRDIDKALNEITVVSTYTTSQVWGMYDSFLAIANATGTASSEIIKVAGEYFKQGKSLTEALVLTEAAAMSARVAGISATESVRYLTAALNGYGLAAEDALNVSDKFSKLAASSATDYSDIAIAMSKVAAQASSMGVEMDNLMGMMTTALEVTQEAPENIGTSFKTIFARMAEIKDLGIVQEDATSANAVAKALNSMGVALFDSTNQMRDLDDVLIEVGNKWKDLDNNTKRYLATTLAGTRQQTRLMAVFENWDKTLGFIEDSAESEGATLAQNAKTYETVQYSLEKMNNAYEKLMTSFGSNSVLRTFLGLITEVINILSTPIGHATMLGGGIALLVGNFKEITTTVAKAEKAIEDFGGQIKRNISDIAKIFSQRKSFNGSNLSNAFKGIQDIFKDGSIVNIADLDNLDDVLQRINDTTELNNKLTPNQIDNLNQLGFAIDKETGKLKLSTTTWTLKNIAMTAGIATITIVIGLLYNLSKRTERLNQELATLYSDQYNNKELINNVKDLVKEYEELNNKIIKTNEELEQMKSLQKQINEYTGGDMFDLNGDIDETAINKWESDSIEKQISYLKDGLNNINKLGGLEEVLASSDASSAAMAKTIATIQELTKNYDDLGEAVKAYYEKLANEGYTEEEKTRADLRIQARTVAGQTYNYTEWVEDPYAIGVGGGYYSDVTEPLSDYIEENTDYDLDDIINNLIEHNSEKTAELEELYGTLPVAVLDLLNATDNAVASSILSLGWTDTVEEALKKQEELLNNYSEDFILSVNDSLSNLGIEKVSREQFEELANIIKNTGIDSEKTFNDLENFAKENGISVEKLINEYIKLAEEIYNIPTIDEQLNVTRLSIKNVQDLNNAIADHSVTFEQLYSYLNSLSEKHRQRVVNDIATEGQISAETAKLIQQNEIDKFNNKIDIQIKEKQAQKIAVEGMIQQTQYMLDNIKVLQDSELDNAINNYNAQMRACQESKNRMLEMERQFQRNVEIIEDGGTAGDINAFEALNKRDFHSQNEFIDNLKVRLEQLKDKWNSLDSEVSALEILKMQGNELFNLGDAFGSVADGAGDAADALEEYERQLNEVAAATERLNAINARMDLLNTYKDLYEGRDGAAYVKLLEQEIELLNEQSKAYENLITAQKQEQNNLKNGVEQAVLDVFEVVDGRLIPVMSKYNNLTDEQAKVADEFFESYNELTDGINDNTTAIIENQNAIKELQEYKRDQTIELQKIIIDAIKAEQKAIYEAQKEALEKQKEYLEKRKQLYEDAFAEEDYNNELSKLEEEKIKLQEQIAGLSGATDSTSKQKRTELEQSLSDILKEINDKTLEYNRDALLDSIDEEIAAKEDEQQTIEEIYNQRVEDYAWLQEQMELIAAEGWETILGYLKQWDEEYIQSTDLMKEKTEEEWKFLYETSNYYLNDTATNAKISFEKISSSLRAETDKMISYWNNVKAAAEAANAIKNNGGRTPKTVYVYDGKEFSTYNQARNHVINTTSPSMAPYINELLSQIKTVTKYSKGGYVKYTGLAMVHGSANNPEAFLSAKDTKNFEALKIALNNNNLTNIGKDGLIIEEINISTQSLNSNQDWNNAGILLGNSLKNALRNRGIVTNLKR